MNKILSLGQRFSKLVFLTIVGGLGALAHPLMGQTAGEIKLLKAEKIPLPKGYDVYTVF